METKGYTVKEFTLTKESITTLICDLHEVAQDFREARALHAAQMIDETIRMLTVIRKEIFND